MSGTVGVYLGDQLARYGFGGGHPFSTKRHAAFEAEFRRRGLDQWTEVLAPAATDREHLELFHIAKYVNLLEKLSVTGEGFLDYGDTPAFQGVFETSCYVAGSVLDAVERMMAGELRRAFVPIAGLHHARRERAGGFCTVNDCGIAIEALLGKHGLERVAYVDIDAHHGDGVFYSFEHDPRVIFADLHEDGHYLYPGTGHANECGTGAGRGFKLNLPMQPGSDDGLFMTAWAEVEEFLERHRPQFILLQCGADSIGGDPLTHMRYTAAAHGHAARRLAALADRCCGGRLLATGGGGYNLRNIGEGWCAVVEGMLDRAGRPD